MAIRKKKRYVQHRPYRVWLRVEQAGGSGSRQIHRLAGGSFRIDSAGWDEDGSTKQVVRYFVVYGYYHRRAALRAAHRLQCWSDAGHCVWRGRAYRLRITVTGQIYP